MSFSSFINRGVLSIVGISLFLSSAASKTWSGDTLRLNPITFKNPSPVGWNVQYKAMVNFPMMIPNGHKYSWFKH